MSAHPESVLHFGRHRIDLVRQRLWRDATCVELRPKTWELLLYLLQRPGVLVSSETLLDALWPGQDVTPKTLTNRVVQLREALGDDPESPQIIQTVHRRGYRLIAPVSGATVESPPAADISVAPPPGRVFVGRESELATLQGLLDTACEGRRQMALVAGDPGLGKTALIDTFVARLAAQGVLCGRGSCVEQASEREAFGPVLALLADLAGGPAAAQTVQLLRRCAPSWLVQMPWLLQADEAQALRHSLLGTGQGRMLRECCVLLEALSQQTPLVLVLEDLHWSDSASIDLLAHFAQGRTAARVLVLGSYQPLEALSRVHPVSGMARRLLAQGQLADLTLQPLPPGHVEAFVAQRFASPRLTQQLTPWAQLQSEGHPLFLAATMDHLVDQGWVAAGPDGWQLTVDLPDLNQALPEHLRQMIETRLAGLDDESHAVLEAASVVGLQFSVQLLEAVLQRPAEALDRICHGLVQRQRLLKPLPAAVWPDGSVAGAYAFVHNAYRRVLYEQLAPAPRRLMHQRVAERLERGHGSRVADVAGALAVAYESAAMPEDAARVLEVAAAVSARRFAYREVAQAIEASLQQVARLPDTSARAQTQIRLQLTLGNLFLAGRGMGHPRALAAYQAAHALSLRIDAPREQMRALMGLCLSHIATGRADEAHRLGLALVQLAHSRQPSLASVAHTYAGMTELVAGRLAAARAQFEQALQLQPDPEVPVLTDTHMLARLHLGRTLIHMGLLEQGQALIDAAAARGRQMGAPFLLIETLYWVADSYRLQRLQTVALQVFDEVLAMADDHVLPYYRTIGLLGRLTVPDAASRALAEIEHGVLQVRSSSESWAEVHLLAELAETQLAQGQVAAAGATLDTAEGRLHTCKLYAVELHRLRGLHGAASGAAAADVEAAFRAGIGLARSQQALLLELRCASSWWAWYRAQGWAAGEARDELARCLARFTEGGDRPELQQAQAWLQDNAG